MISFRPTSTSHTTFIASKLTSVVPDQKDQEVIFDETNDVQLSEHIEHTEHISDHSDHSEHTEANESDEEQVQEQSSDHLSIRAEQVKDSLSTDGVIVNAVLITSDGEFSQIKYNTSCSLKEANIIVGSKRVTIIGELEELSAIAVCAMHTSQSQTQSSSYLPYPLCQSGSISGDVLLYRCDENATAQDLSIDEYSKYCQVNQDLTESSIKLLLSGEEREIHSQSIVPNESGYTLSTLSLELANQFTSSNSSAGQSEINEYVASKIDSIINESIENSSPLNDPDYDVDDDSAEDSDYNPENEEDQQQEQLDLDDDDYNEFNDESHEIVERIQSIYFENNGTEIDQNELELTAKEISDLVEQTNGDYADYDDDNEYSFVDDDESDLDESAWRGQLDDALNFVRAKGIHDGQGLADSVAQIYHENHGSYPTQDSLFDIFDGIQSELAEEAIDAQNDSYSDESDSEQDLDESVWRQELDQALNFVRAKGRHDGQELAESVSQIYFENNGSHPTQENLLNIFNGIQSSLAEEAIDAEYDQDVSDLNDESDLDESEWRDELNLALNFVRAKGKHDGEQLAKSVYHSYHESHGSHPTQDTFLDIFDGIQSELAAEAIDAEENDYDDIDESDLDESDLEESSWRQELDDALDLVRAKGRHDGEQLAELVEEIYYGRHGSFPTQSELADIFKDTLEQMAVEINEDDDLEAVVDHDDGTAYNYSVLNEIDDLNDADPTDLIEYSSRVLSENVVAQVVASWQITKKRQPTLDELTNSVSKKCDSLMETMVSFYENNYLENDESDSIDEEIDEQEVSDLDEQEVDVDDVDVSDEEQAEIDDVNDDDYVVEDDAAVSGDDSYNGDEQEQLLQSPVKYSKLNGNGESYSIYFGTLPSKGQELKMLDAAVASFEMRNQRIPNAQEMRVLKTTVFVPNRSEVRMLNEDDEKLSELVVRGKSLSTQTKLLVTPVKTKKNKSARYDILLDQKSTMGSAKKEQTAIEWFERFNNRKPTKEEIDNIRKFVETDSDNLKLELFDVVAMEDDEKSGIDSYHVTSVNVKSNKATKYTLNDDNTNQSGDVDSAIQWFSRFNGRQPTKEELHNIYAFQNDIEDTHQINDDLKEDDTIDIE